ncbi:MAG: hypothetical protein N0A16_06955 [Blastocatellia bacterium]|nr:hypothetical protein [Blastocatellia bacterium]MCS7157449.1 hypothetical protein [Blastocatellia bacterium]MCX7752622.1 hypothetical protein [Blastocatellia bacterium]MDW8168353.1 hypothetical protein [Acidobacteriota bacterium]MDW8255549.1 hypothetical protein [Acidobacteriota bacterium]
MNPAHVHLLLNHIPVIGLWLGIVLYLVALVKKPEWRSLSLGVFVLMAVLTLPAYLSGEPAEEMLHGWPGISEATIEEHEEAALPTLITMLVLGAVALVGLVRFRSAGTWSRGYGWFVLVLALAAGILIGRTAHLGAYIRHPEIRSTTPATASEPNEFQGQGRQESR